MSGVQGITDQIADVARHKYFRADDVIKDGIHYCAKCGGAKEGDFPTAEGFPAIHGAFPCPCQQEEIDRQNKLFEEQQRHDRIETIRRIGLRTSALRSSTFEVDDSPKSNASALFRRYCERWDQVKENGLGIRIFGSVGTGKSFYAACVANYVIDHGDKAYFISLPELMAIANDFKGEQHDVSMHEVKHYLKHSDLVIFDDLGAQRTTSFAYETLFDVVSTRYETGKPTIVTTNLNDHDLKNPERIEDERIYDRVLEMCQIPLKLASKSRRKDLSQKGLKLAAEILGG